MNTFQALSTRVQPGAESAGEAQKGSPALGTPAWAVLPIWQASSSAWHTAGLRPREEKPGDGGEKEPGPERLADRMQDLSHVVFQRGT